jgi:hypothetical protein
MTGHDAAMNANDLFWGLFGIVAWFAILTVCLYLAIGGLRSGVVRAKLGSYSRTDDPGWFWACIAMYCGLAAFVFYLTTLIVADALRGG